MQFANNLVKSSKSMQRYNLSSNNLIENRRERFLSLSEIKSFWHGLEKAPLSPLSKLAFKIQLLTAQSQSTVISAKW